MTDIFRKEDKYTRTSEYATFKLDRQSEKYNICTMVLSISNVFRKNMDFCGSPYTVDVTDNVVCQAKPDRRMLRKGRTFTAEATHILQGVFSRTSHPSCSEMRHLADKLAVPEKSVCAWFKNKRTRLAKSGNTPPTSPNIQEDRSATLPLLHLMESVTLTPNHPFYQFSCARIQETANTSRVPESRQKTETCVVILAPDTNVATSLPVDLSHSQKRKHSCSDTDEGPYQRRYKRQTYTDFSINAILGLSWKIFYKLKVFLCCWVITVVCFVWILK